MKLRLTSTLIILTLAIGLGACRRSSNQEGVKSSPDAGGLSTTTMTESGKQAKWRMPEAMMKHMRNLELDVHAVGSSAEQDHAALATKIDGHTKQLIASCTMDGDAHQALHDWLMPFLQLNKDYAAAPDAAAKSARFKEIQEALAVFNERFE